MNLKHRLSYKTTATVRIISETKAIFSDEISPDTKDCLRIIEGTTKQDLWYQITQAALSFKSKFVPCINLITDDCIKVIQLGPEPILIKTLKHEAPTQNIDGMPF